jgi:hypothetical protein
MPSSVLRLVTVKSRQTSEYNALSHRHPPVYFRRHRVFASALENATSNPRVHRECPSVVTKSYERHARRDFAGSPIDARVGVDHCQGAWTCGCPRSPAEPVKGQGARVEASASQGLTGKQNRFAPRLCDSVKGYIGVSFPERAAYLGLRALVDGTGASSRAS